MRSLLLFSLACTSPAAPAVDPEDPDGDRILTVHEGDADPDGDGVPAWNDPDSDGDGLPDREEAGDDDPLTLPSNADGDALPDFLDTDSDGNGVRDGREFGSSGRIEDSDGDGALDPHDLDDDDDGVLDVEEMFPGADRNTDGDPDVDRLDTDSDDDGAPDADEARRAPGLPLRDTDGDETPDLRDTDSDNDGFSDHYEVAGTSPPRDTDGDGTPDLRDRDSDNDGVRDREETAKGSHPFRHDSDSDGYPDAVERSFGSDPADPASRPPSRLITLPGRRFASTTTTQIAGARRADVLLHVDKASDDDLAFYEDDSPEVHGNVRSFFDGLPARILASGPDVALAVARQGGRPSPDGLRGAGSGPDLIDVTHMSYEAPELDDIAFGDPSINSVYQAITGIGYDRNCDGFVRKDHDILPFLPYAEDPFGGQAGGRYNAARPSLGLEGGVGFRPYSARVLVHVPQILLFFPGGSWGPRGSGDYVMPVWLPYGGCPLEPTEDDLLTALHDHRVKYLGVDLYGACSRFFSERSVGPNSELYALPQMKHIARMARSYYDVDHDGDDDPAVLESGCVAAPHTLEYLAREIADVVQSKIHELQISELSLRPEVDEGGFFLEASPATIPYLGDDAGQEASFDVTLFGNTPAKPADQVFRLRLTLVGDGEVALNAEDFLVLVPGVGDPVP